MPEIYEVTATGSPSTITEYVDGTAVTQTTATGLSVIGALNAATINSAGTINLTPSSGLQINGSAGTANYVLTSQGASLPPIWAVAPGASSGYATGVRQIVTAAAPTVSTTTTSMPQASTAPTSTQGAQFASATITPQSSSSSILIIASIQGSINAVATATAAIFRDAQTSAICAGSMACLTASTSLSFMFWGIVSSGSTAASTFKLRAGPGGAQTLTVNGAGGGQLLGTASSTGIVLVEFGA